MFSVPIYAFTHGPGDRCISPGAPRLKHYTFDPRPKIAAEAHAVIRKQATEIFGEEFAASLRILYGGSVKPENASAFMAQEEIDGALVGGASLAPKSFAAIVKD